MINHSKVPKVKLKGEECSLKFGFYMNGRLAIQLITRKNTKMATATANLPEHDLPEGRVFIKDWSENEGMYQALLEAGVIGEYTRKVPTGFVYALECPIKGMETKDPWEEDPEIPVKDWQYEVAANDTRLGYLDWVAHQKETMEQS